MKQTMMQKAGAALLALCLAATLLPTVALAEGPVQPPQRTEPQAFAQQTVCWVATALEFKSAVAAMTADTESGNDRRYRKRHRVHHCADRGQY